MRHPAIVLAGVLLLFGCESKPDAPASSAGGSGASSSGTGGAGGTSSGVGGGGTSSGAGNAGQTPMAGGSAGASSGAGSAGVSSGTGGAGGQLASGGAAGGPEAGAGQGPGGGGGGGLSANGGGAGMPPTDGGLDAMPDTPLALLVFTRTGGYRHEAIPAAIAALTTLASERDWTVTATEDPTTFTDEGLAPYDVLVFALTSDDLLDTDQQAAFERFMRSGKGLAGVHSATATEYDWPFYVELMGASFRAHPVTQAGTIVVEDAAHPATSMLPARWTRTDEWYSFLENPRPNVHVLLTLDESSYDPADTAMGTDHPIAWTNELDGVRVFHTALGHTQESYSEPLFLEHIAFGIEWAGGRVP